MFIRQLNWAVLQSSLQANDCIALTSFGPASFFRYPQEPRRSCRSVCLPISLTPTECLQTAQLSLMSLREVLARRCTAQMALNLAVSFNCSLDPNTPATALWLPICFISTGFLRLAWQPTGALPLSLYLYIVVIRAISLVAYTTGTLHVADTAQLLRGKKWAKSFCLIYDIRGASL